MQLSTLKLDNFRNYKTAEFRFDGLSVVEGKNGVGKSNLLEAVYLLATGKSFRADSDSEMIRYGEPLATIYCQSATGSEARIILTDGSERFGRKKFEINGVSKRMMDFVGNVKAVLFGPQDMDLLTGSPSLRRRYLDFVLTQGDREYRRCLVSYEKGLRQRNRLLDFIRDGRAVRHQLYFWDRLLIKNGEYLTVKRSEYCRGFASEQLTIEYDKSVISEARLKQYEVEEVAAATTLVGPHRDDFGVDLFGKDVAKYGSRGEQRMAILWLKMGERDFLSEHGERPILLLDDIFSELDHKHRDDVMVLVHEQIDNGGQAIMTTADEHLVPKIDGGKIIQLGYV